MAALKHLISRRDAKAQRNLSAGFLCAFASLREILLFKSETNINTKADFA
jgi:hypothetical protein